MPRIVVTGRDAKVTSRHKEHAQEKLAKLDRYFDGLLKVEAVLAHAPDRAEIEVLLSVQGGKPLVCRAHGKDLYAAVDLVLDKAEVLLTKHKEKLKGRKNHGGRGEKMIVEEAAAREEVETAEPEEESYQDIVEKRRFS